MNWCKARKLPGGISSGLFEDVFTFQDPYPMTLPKLGHAIIVNNVERDFPGSTLDVDAMTRAFEEMGLEVDDYPLCNQKVCGCHSSPELGQESHYIGGGAFVFYRDKGLAPVTPSHRNHINVTVS